MLSRAKEPFNTWAHAAGVLLGIPGLVTLLLLADGDPKRSVAFAIYGSSLIVLYQGLHYALERPDPYPAIFGHHEIFHLFVLGGSVAHFVFVAGYVA